MSDHRGIDVPGIANGMDVEVVELVKLLNGIPAIETTSSCQGNPGEIIYSGGGVTPTGHYGHVAMRWKEDWTDWKSLSNFIFGELYPVVVELGDDVGVEVTSVEQGQFNGWLRFRNEALVAVTEAMKALALQY